MEGCSVGMTANDSGFAQVWNLKSVLKYRAANLK
jgi:hypothetical protein